MADVLQLMADTYKMLDNVVKAIGHIAEVLKHTGHQITSDKNTKSFTEIVKEMQVNFSIELDSKLTALEKKLMLPSPTQKQLESMAKELGLAAECIKASTNNIGKSVMQVTNTSSQLASTTTNYKDVLLKSSEQQSHSQLLESLTQVDLRILRRYIEVL